MRSTLVTMGRQTFRADVAGNFVVRARGLSGRAVLAEDEAMLFIFPIAMRYSFWMKGMKFPLDIIWIRKGRIVDMSENVPVPAANASIASMISSGVRPKTVVDAVLEVNAGVARKLGLKVGDSVEW